MQPRQIALVLLLLIVIFTTSCSASQPPILVTQAADFDVAPVFREFYNFLGGYEVLGAVISEPQEIDGRTYQYVVTGLMVFDPQAVAKRRFQLAGLGNEFGVEIPSDSDWAVAEVFQPLYKRLGGEDFIGRALTGMVYNSEKNRTEQYFENLGFYQGPETDGNVRLLPYGAWRCGQDCANAKPLNAAPFVPVPTHAPEAQPALPAPPPTAQPVAHKWLIQVWETSPMVASDQEQDIGISIQRDGLLFEGAQASLIVELPDGTVRNEDFPPTGPDGVAHIKVEPIETTNGTIIPYQVCIASESGDKYCIRQSFLIWTTP